MFKGGLFLYSIINFDSPNLEKIIVVQIGNDFVSFEVKDVAPIDVANFQLKFGQSALYF